MQLRDFKHDVFISYSRRDYVREDKSVIKGSPVDRVIQALEESGISYWIDREGIYTGDEFQEVICSAIEEARVFLFISSESSNSSQWTPGEIATAIDLDMDIIPFKIDDSLYNKKIRIRLAPLDRIEISKMGESAYTQLVKSIRQHVDRIKALEAERDARKRGDQERLEKCQKGVLEISFIDDHIKNYRNKRDEIIRELSALGYPVDGFIDTPAFSPTPSPDNSAMEKELADCKRALSASRAECAELKKEIERLEKLLKSTELSLTQKEQLVVSQANEITRLNNALSSALSQVASYDVVLKACGPEKLKVIKRIVEITGFGLREAKEYVDYAPSTIKEGLSIDEAESVKIDLEEIGATVELKISPTSARPNSSVITTYHPSSKGSKTVPERRIKGHVEIYDTQWGNSSTYPVYDAKCWYCKIDCTKGKEEMWCKIDESVKFMLEPVAGERQMRLTYPQEKFFSSQNKTERITPGEEVYISGHYRIKVYQ